MKKAIDLTGNTYNGIKVIERDFEEETKRKKEGKYSKVFWKCVCHCGKGFSTMGTSLKSNNIKSCGCMEYLRKERMALIGKNQSKENDWIFRDGLAIGIIKGKETFYIDEDNYDKVKRYCWRVGTDEYIIANSKDCTTKVLKIYNIIMNPPKGFFVDHKDGDTMNNREYNLRICTKSQNNMNIKKRTDNISGFTGVKQNKTSGNWTAQIDVDHVRIHLGTFVNFDDAVEARKKANIKYHGEFSGSKRRGEE